MSLDLMSAMPFSIPPDVLFTVIATPTNFTTTRLALLDIVSDTDF